MWYFRSGNASSTTLSDSLCDMWLYGRPALEAARICSTGKIIPHFFTKFSATIYCNQTQGSASQRFTSQPKAKSATEASIFASRMTSTDRTFQPNGANKPPTTSFREHAEARATKIEEGTAGFGGLGGHNTPFYPAQRVSIFQSLCFPMQIWMSVIFIC